MHMLFVRIEETPTEVWLVVIDIDPATREVREEWARMEEIEVQP